MSSLTSDRFLSRAFAVRITAAACTIPLAFGLAGCKEDALSSTAGTDASSAEVAPMSEDAPATSAVESSTVQAPTPASGDGVNREFVAEALSSTLDTLEDPAAPLDLTQLLTGTVLDEFDNQRMEWENNGWHQEGESTIVNTELLPSEDPNVAIAKVCVDSSGVRVLDENNNVVNDNVPASEKRSLMIVTFKNENGSWKFADRQFPDDPRC